MGRPRDGKKVDNVGRNSLSEEGNGGMHRSKCALHRARCGVRRSRSGPQLRGMPNRDSARLVASSNRLPASTVRLAIASNAAFTSAWVTVLPCAHGGVLGGAHGGILGGAHGGPHEGTHGGADGLCMSVCVSASLVHLAGARVSNEVGTKVGNEGRAMVGNEALLIGREVHPVDVGVRVACRGKVPERDVCVGVMKRDGDADISGVANAELRVRDSREVTELTLKVARASSSPDVITLHRKQESKGLDYNNGLHCS